MARAFLRSRRRLLYGCLYGRGSPCRAGVLFVFVPANWKRGCLYVRYHFKRHGGLCPRPGAAGRDGGGLSCGGGGQNRRGLPRFAGAIRRGGGGGLWGRADPAVLRGPPPPRSPVPHAGHGHGFAASGVAKHLYLPHRGPVRRPGLRPGDLPQAGPGAH